MAQTALQRAYNTLRKKKAAYCAGKVNKTAVKQAAANYIKSAISKGQTKAEANRKAKRVMSSGCKMTSRISGTKKSKTTRRRKK